MLKGEVMQDIKHHVVLWHFILILISKYRSKSIINEITHECTNTKMMFEATSYAYLTALNTQSCDYKNSSKESMPCEQLNQNSTRAPHAILKLACQGPSIYLKLLVNKGHYSKNITFRYPLSCNCTLSWCGCISSVVFIPVILFK